MKEIECVVKNFPTKKIPGPTDKVYQIFKEEITSILHKSYQKKEEREHFPAHTLITKININMRKETTDQYPHKHRCFGLMQINTNTHLLEGINITINALGERIQQPLF